MATAPKTTKKTTAKPMAAKAVETATKSATIPAVDVAVQNSQETVDTMVKTSTAVAKKGVEKAVAISEDQFAAVVKASKDAVKGYEEILDFSRSNIDAVVKSNEILSEGMRGMSESYYKLAQEQFHDSVDMVQKLVNCKSPVEVFALQSDLVRKNFMRTVAESRKFTEQSTKLVEKAGKPIAERVTVAVDVLAKPLAA